MYLDGVAVALGQLLDDNRIGAGRHKAAGENARRLSGADTAGERPAGGNLADDLQAYRGVGHVGRAHGVTVHGRDIGRRLGAQRFEIVGQHAAVGFRERHLVGRQRAGMRQYLFKRLGDRNQRHGSHSRIQLFAR